MRFTIPQFIEHEAKIIGPLTFKQFVFVGIAALICFILYFSVSFELFLLGCIVLGGTSAAFAFLKIEGIPLPQVVSNFLKFSFSPKKYLWEKKEQKEPSLKKK